MPSLSSFKTTNSSFWTYVSGIPCWRLNWSGNVWDAVIDAVAAAVATFVPYAPAGLTVPVTVTASPFTYTAGSGPEVLYIDSDGVVSSVTRHGQALAASLPLTVLLPPGGSVTITYTAAPTIIKDY